MQGGARDVGQSNPQHIGRGTCFSFSSPFNGTTVVGTETLGFLFVLLPLGVPGQFAPGPFSFPKRRGRDLRGEKGFSSLHPTHQQSLSTRSPSPLQFGLGVFHFLSLCLLP